MTPPPLPVKPQWAEPLSTWIGWLTAGGLPQSTIYLRTYQLRRLAISHPTHSPWELDVDNLSGWLSSHDWSRETLRSYRAAMRSFYGWGHSTGRTSTNPAALLRKIPPAQARPRPANEAVVSDGLHDADARGWLMIMLGSRHGLRRCEIARVHSDDVQAGAQPWLTVHGKGAKDRSVPLLPDVARAITNAAGWAFPNGRGSHLSAGHVGRVLRVALHDAATPHQLRHRFATVAYQATKDLRAVQELLGHASPTTTQIYTAVPNDTLIAALMSAA